MRGRGRYGGGVGEDTQEEGTKDEERLWRGAG